MSNPRAHEVVLSDLFAALVGQDAAHIAAVEFALTESAKGHFHCAREALRSVPDTHLRRAVTGAAVLSRLATDVLTDRNEPPASPVGVRR